MQTKPNAIVKMNEIVGNFRPITLAEMSGIKLMNRTDTKFVTTVERLCQLLTLARDDYRAQEVDGQRLIPYSTIYFDTPDYNMYETHQRGRVNRQKLRIRSYVDSNLNFLEVKTKDNHGRTKKKRVEMKNFDPKRPDYDIHFLRQNEEYVGYDDFLRTYLRYAPETMEEKIANRFLRLTLVNNAKTERLTIDTSLEFLNLATGISRKMDNLAIIELKRDGLQYSPILELLRQLRIKPSGFSKYCIGSALTNPELKQNLFKKRLRRYEKIINNA